MRAISRVLFPLLLSMVLLAPAARADVISLYEWALNVNSAVYTNGASLPAYVDTSAFDSLTGLGTLTLTYTTPGTLYAGAFLDHEIDEATNTFFNERGEAIGVAPAGLTWQIDEPGYTFGTIYNNLVAGTLNNSATSTQPEDMSMALAWNLVLNAGDQATVTYLVSQTVPGAGFYLHQWDPDSQVNLYLSSTSSVGAVGPSVPEPGGLSLLVLVAALTCLGARRARTT